MEACCLCPHEIQPHRHAVRSRRSWPILSLLQPGRDLRPGAHFRAYDTDVGHTSCAFATPHVRPSRSTGPDGAKRWCTAWSRTGALQSRCTRGTRPARTTHHRPGGPMQQCLLQNRVEIPMLADTGAVFRHHVLEEVDRRTDSAQIRKFPRALRPWIRIEPATCRSIKTRMLNAITGSPSGSGGRSSRW